MAAGVVLVGCTVYSGVSKTEPRAAGRTSAPVRAYLPEGHIVLFESGITITADTVRGAGVRYDAGLNVVETLTSIPLDSLVAMEAVQGTGPNVPATVLASAAGIGVGALAAAALAVAVFGSCPTVYVPAAEPGQEILVAELFSHSVAPLLEARDVDGYPGAPADGVLRIDLRNEALETHFINHLEFLEVQGWEGEEILPDVSGRPIALSGWLTPTQVVDRAGRDLAEVLARADESAFATLQSRVASATADDLTDHIEIVFPRPTDTDSVAVDLRLRNSLLNTVLLYDFLLSGSDLRGMRWLTETLQQVGTAVEFGAWYRERMGLRVEVWDGAAWQWAGRYPDTGPIAWKSAAAVVPVPEEGEEMRIRLSFLADHWRIDRLRVAAGVRRPEARTLPVSRVVGTDQDDVNAMREALLRPDELYLETRPGTALFVEFQTDAGPGERSYLLSSQGYYTEWIRPGWVREGSGPDEPFVPGDEALVAVLERWAEVQDDMEARFEASRIPTSRGGGR